MIATDEDARRARAEQEANEAAELVDALRGVTGDGATGVRGHAVGNRELSKFARARAEATAAKAARYRERHSGWRESGQG
jgi:hypothetical protein